MDTGCEVSTYPLGLFQLLIELVKGLTMFLSHLGQLLFVNSGVIVQSLFKVGHLCLTLGPEREDRRSACL